MKVYLTTEPIQLGSMYDPFARTLGALSGPLAPAGQPSRRPGARPLSALRMLQGLLVPKKNTCNPPRPLIDGKTVLDNSFWLYHSKKGILKETAVRRLHVGDSEPWAYESGSYIWNLAQQSFWGLQVDCKCDLHYMGNCNILET